MSFDLIDINIFFILFYQKPQLHYLKNKIMSKKKRKEKEYH